MIAMSEEAKVIAFVAFCVESYKAAKATLKNNYYTKCHSRLLSML